MLCQLSCLCGGFFKAVYNTNWYTSRSISPLNLIVSLSYLISLLSLYRMKHMAAYLMLVLGGNDSPTADDVSKALSSVGIESDSEQLDKLISELDGKDLSEILTSGEALLAKFGSGGGGGGGGGTFIFLLVLYINYVSLLLII